MPVVTVSPAEMPSGPSPVSGRESRVSPVKEGPRGEAGRLEARTLPAIMICTEARKGVADMSIVVNLSPSEEARLSDAALRSGLEPEEVVRKLLSEHLPGLGPNDELDNVLSDRQKKDNIKLMPSHTAAELFGKWDREASLMTDAEREAEDQLWEDFQKGINETRAELGMRQL